MKMTKAEIRLVNWEKVGPELFVALRDVIEDKNYQSLNRKTKYKAEDAHAHLLQSLRPLELVS